MGDYKLLLQVCIIVVLLFILYIIFKIVRSIFLRNRLDYYSVNIDEGIEYKSLYKFIFKMGEVLNRVTFVNEYAKIYDNYIYEDSKLKRGIDYVSLKIISGIFLSLLYLFFSFLYKNDIVYYLIIISFVLGFILPDFYLYFLKDKKSSINSQQILKAIIIMNNGYKVNKSTEYIIKEVIQYCDGNLKYEFKKFLYDFKIGLDISSAYYRMYYRTNVKVFKNLGDRFKLVELGGLNIVNVFDDLEQWLIEQEKVTQELKVYYSINKVAHLLFLFLPLIFTIWTIVSNDKYLDIIFSNVGVFLILILSIIYLVYLLFLRRIIGGNYYEEN